MISHLCVAGFEAVVLRDRTLEEAPLLSYLGLTVGLRGGGGEDEDEDEDEGVGLVEGEDLVAWIWEASRATSAVEIQCIIRWTTLTLRSNSGVSQQNLSSFIFFFDIKKLSTSQTNRHKAGGTPPATGVGDHPRNPAG